MNHRLRRFRWPLTVVAAAAIAIFLSWHWIHEPVAAETDSAGRQPLAVPVTAGIAESHEVPIFLTALGTAQGFNTVTVRPRIDGQLLAVQFTEGQDVKTGDVLAKIDPRPFQAQLAQTQATKAKDEAQLANAKRDLERVTSLAARQFATTQSVDSQKSAVQQLAAAVDGDQAAIDNASVQLSYTTITSPIDGRTGIRLVDAGNIVHANDQTGLVVISQIQPISVVFTLPQDALDQVIGAMSHGPLTVLAYKRDDVTQQGEGTLALIDNQIDATSGTIRLKATFPNTDTALWPGEFVNVRLLVAVRHDAVTVPAQVVQRGPNGTFAYVIKDDQTVEMRPIKVGPVRDGVALIEQGLSAGERIVIDGQYKVQPGSRVQDSTAAPKSVANQG